MTKWEIYHWHTNYGEYYLLEFDTLWAAEDWVRNQIPNPGWSFLIYERESDD